MCGLSIAPVPITLNDLQGSSPIASFFFRCYFSYSYAVVDKISTDLKRHAVPMQYILRIVADVQDLYVSVSGQVSCLNA